MKIIASLAAMLFSLGQATTADLTMRTRGEVVGDVPVREPMVVEHPDGTLFVGGYGRNSSTASLWRSDDQGASWSPINLGAGARGYLGNSDVDLAVHRDGTLYFVTMTYDGKANEGTQISVGVTHDRGASWNWAMLSKSRFDDRPWVEVAPDGVAHVIWNDGKGICHSVSNDSGKTWRERPRIHSQGGSSHFAIGPKGELAVRITPVSASGQKLHKGVDLIAVSTDTGNTWIKHKAPGERGDWVFPLSDSDPLPRWVEPLAWDRASALYSLWTTATAQWLARSNDQGQSWKTWKVGESSSPSYFPYLVGRDPGQLAATWFSGPVGDSTLHAAAIQLDGDHEPAVSESGPIRPDIWNSGSADAPPSRDTGGEYVAIMFLRNGGLVMVTPIQDPRRKRFGFSLWRPEP